MENNTLISTAISSTLDELKNIKVHIEDIKQMYQEAHEKEKELHDLATPYRNKKAECLKINSELAKQVEDIKSDLQVSYNILKQYIKTTPICLGEVKDYTNDNTTNKAIASVIAEDKMKDYVEFDDVKLRERILKEVSTLKKYDFSNPREIITDPDNFYFREFPIGTELLVSLSVFLQDDVVRRADTNNKYNRFPKEFLTRSPVCDGLQLFPNFTEKCMKKGISRIYTYYLTKHNIPISNFINGDNVAKRYFINGKDPVYGFGGISIVHPNRTEVVQFARMIRDDFQKYGIPIDNIYIGLVKKDPNKSKSKKKSKA